MLDLALADLDAAAALIRARGVPETPQYAWPLLAERTGCEVVLKHENHTPTGAFKVRGGVTYLDHLAKSGGCKGIATATRGNHGQSIPYAAAAHGIPVEVWVPHGNSVEKNAAMRAWGAELVVHGRDFEEARAACAASAEDRGLHLIPPFHRELVRGVATYAVELLRNSGPLDAIYVPVGMGSGAVGCGLARDLLGAPTEVVGVVSAHADAYARSFERGEIVTTETAVTLADGMACRAPWAEPLDILRKGLARMVRVTDDEVAEAMRTLYADTHNLAEGAGAAPFAALMQERERLAGKRAAAILCGGNVDSAVFAEVLAGRTPKP